jgi:hypothetical protein
MREPIETQMDHEAAVQSRAAERYLLGEMPAAERDGFESHFFQCAQCGEDVKAADLFVENARAAMAETPAEMGARRPAGAARPVSQGSGFWGWLRPMVPHPAFAAIALALVAYPWIWVIPRLKQGGQPIGLTATVLHPESRGEPAQVKPRPGEPLLLVLDVNVSESVRRYIAVISSGSGNAVREVEVTAPPPGEPLHLLVPNLTLSAGVYSLTLHDAAAGVSSPELARYRFAVSHSPTAKQQ